MRGRAGGYGEPRPGRRHGEPGPRRRLRRAGAGPTRPVPPS